MVRAPYDIFVGTPVDYTDDISQLKYLNAPQYKVEVANKMSSYDELLAFTDQARSQCASLVTLVIQEWQNHDKNKATQS